MVKDLSNKDSVETMIDETYQEMGKIDIKITSCVTMRELWME